MYMFVNSPEVIWLNRLILHSQSFDYELVLKPTIIIYLLAVGIY